MASRRVLCYAEEREGQWEAVGLDFDIAVQGESFGDVHGALREVVTTYVEDVDALPAADQARLLARRVPWLVRFGFAARLVWSLLGRGRDDQGPRERGQFEMSCPA